MKFYPLVFFPILKERIWGGTKLNTILNKSIFSDKVGESWEISTVSEDVSIVSNGAFQGKTIQEIIDLYPNEILGESVVLRFGKKFPLLFKFIDAQQDLSIQLHPNDELAQKRHNSLGKTEMWYVMQADKNARLVVGFKENCNQETYLQHLKSKTLVTILNEIEVQEGDVFFLETGTIHAIGAGIVIAEIQQTSDITYRIYDWDRVDASGNQRELHTELALEAINYQTKEAKISYEKEINTSNAVISCDYFTTKVIPLQGTFEWKKTKDAFTVFMCTKGNFELQIANETYSFSSGNTILIPAIIAKLQLVGNANLLEISI
jgi:mannose-6-phosphate isomerase